EEMPDEHHDHLIDVQSGKVIEFHNEQIEELQRFVAETLGYKLVDHRLELYGVPLDVDGEKKRKKGCVRGARLASLSPFSSAASWSSSRCNGWRSNSAGS